jgi:hypothetical protein
MYRVVPAPNPSVHMRNFSRHLLRNRMRRCDIVVEEESVARFFQDAGLNYDVCLVLRDELINGLRKKLGTLFSCKTTQEKYVYLVHSVICELRRLPIRGHPFQYIWTRPLSLWQFVGEEALASAILPTFRNLFRVIIRSNIERLRSKR